MKVLRALDYQQVPWKNGGGVTREVLVSWHDDRQLAWDWRISIATVAQSGPFSNFPGIDRSIAVLDGEGMTLRLSGKRTVQLDQSTDPFAFSGEDAVMCDTLSGPTTDLNVMTSRADFRHTLRKRRFSKRSSLSFHSGTNIIIANCALCLQHTGQSVPIERHDAIVDLPLEGSVSFSTSGEGDVFVIQIHRIDGGGGLT
jgi:uncharacterized protein